MQKSVTLANLLSSVTVICLRENKFECEGDYFI